MKNSCRSVASAKQVTDFVDESGDFGEYSNLAPYYKSAAAPMSSCCFGYVLDQYTQISAAWAPPVREEEFMVKIRRT